MTNIMARAALRGLTSDIWRRWLWHHTDVCSSNTGWGRCMWHTGVLHCVQTSKVERGSVLVTIRRWPQIIAWWVELNFHCARIAEQVTTSMELSHLQAGWWSSDQNEGVEFKNDICTRGDWPIYWCKSCCSMESMDQTLLCGSPLWAWKSAAQGAIKYQRRHNGRVNGPICSSQVHRRHQRQCGTRWSRRALLRDVHKRHLWILGTLLLIFFWKKTA